MIGSRKAFAILAMCIVYSIPIFFVVFATGNPPLTSSAQMHRCQMLTLQRMESTCKMILSLSMLCCAYDVFGTLQFSFPHSSMSTCSLFTFHDRSMSHSARVTTQCHPLIFWQKISSNTFLHIMKSSNFSVGLQLSVNSFYVPVFKVSKGKE